MRKAKLFQKPDERILGDGNFVEEVLAVSQEHMERKYHLRVAGLPETPGRGLNLLRISNHFLFRAFRTDTVGCRAPSFLNNPVTPCADSLIGPFPFTFIPDGYNPDPMLRETVPPGK